MRILISAASLLALTAATVPAQTYYNFPRNDTLTYRGVTRMQTAMSSSTPVGPQEIGMRLDATLKLHRFADDSVMIWYDSIGISVDNPVMPMPTDQMAASMKSMRFRIHWDQRGGMRPGAGRAPGAEALEGMLSGIMAFPRLPAGGITNGSVWTDTVRLDLEMQPGMKSSGAVITNYRVVGDTVIDGRAGLIIDAQGKSDTKVEATTGAMQMTGTQKGETTGRMVLLKDGVLALMLTQTVMSGSTEVTSPMAMSATTRSTVDGNMTLIPKPR